MKDYKHYRDNPREALEFCVYLLWKEAIISISRGRELLGFQYMEEMRDWLNNYTDT